MKKYKNMLGLVSLALIFTVLLNGCSSNGGIYTKSADSANYNYAEESPYYDEYLYEKAGGDYDYEVGAVPEYANKVDSGNSVYREYDMLSENSNNLPTDRKIIRDARIVMEVDEVEKSFDEIIVILNGFGGYEASSDMRTSIPNVNATLKIPANKLDAFLAELKNIGEVITSNITSSDVSDQYFDAEIRLETLEKTLEKYYEYLATSADIESQLSITYQISNITYDIEQLKGSLRRWNSLIEYSTVNIELYKTYEPPEPVREINWNSLSLDDMGWYISSGFLSVCNTIFSILQWIVIIIATISPIIVPLFILILILVLYVKRKNKKNRLKIENAKKISNNNNNSGNI